MKPSQWIGIGAFWAAIGVALGAFGAHALKDELVAAGQLENWHTAVRYQVWHALALIAYGIIAERRPLAAYAGWAFLVGSFLFSGSIYCLARDVLRPVMGPLTPIGGALLISAWITLGVSAIRAGGDDRAA
jgi:uncharacterized membrane protein YgdD (TMEM256/DUF423 family)